MNKKTVLSVLLCGALLSTATSCNRSNAIYSVNSTDFHLSAETTSEINTIQMKKTTTVSYLKTIIPKK